MAQVLMILPATWEIWIELVASRFILVKPRDMGDEPLSNSQINNYEFNSKFKHKIL